MAGLGTTPGRPVGAEDIRDLRSRALQTHRRVTPAAGPSWSGVRAGWGVERRGVELLMSHLDRRELLQEIDDLRNATDLSLRSARACRPSRVTIEPTRTI